MTDKKLTKAEERRRDKARTDDVRYIEGIYPPRRIPKGRVLAHNHVSHTANMPSGLNGFRYWTWREDLRPEHFVPCPCGWSGLPHFASNASSGKCITEKQLEKLLGMSIAEVMFEMKGDMKHFAKARKGAKLTK